jgi:hypothetical protein
MYSLRQKTYGIFIRPYVEFGGDNLVQRGSLYVVTPCQPNNANCVSYTAVKGGQGWVLYDDAKNGMYHTSFAIIREIIKDIMDTLGYSKNDILVTEVSPIDTIVTPLT